MALRSCGQLVMSWSCGGGAMGRLLSAELGSAQVADEADDVLRYEPPDGAAGVDAEDDSAVGVQHEAGRLQERRAGVDERPRRIGDRGGVGAVGRPGTQAMAAR